MRNKTDRTEGLLFYIITPLVFAVIIVFAAYFILKPVLAPAADIIELISMRQGDDSGSDDFVRIADNRDIAFGSFAFPTVGKKFGHIKVESTSIDCGFYMGDAENLLKKGVGMSVFSSLPGDHGTTLVAGHCASYFSTLGNAKIGDSIYLDTSYGNFEFEIYDIQIRKANSFSESELENGNNELILYTCYPFNTLFSVSQRYFVYAKYVSGPNIIR